MSDNNQTQAAPQEPSRRHRKWPYIVGGIVLLLIIFVWCIPYLLSTHAGTQLAESIVNGQIKGTLHMDRLSLSWGGPSYVYGLQVKDPAGRTVLAVPEIRWSGGAWNAATDVMSFDRLDVNNAAADLYVLSEGGTSIAQAFESRKPSPAKKAKLPSPRGIITLSSAVVRVIQPDGRTLKVSDVSTQLTLDTLDKISTTGDARLADGGELKWTSAVRDLVTGQEIHPDEAVGELNLQTPQPVNLGPILQFVSNASTASGSAEISIDADFSAGLVEAKLALAGKNLQAGREGEQVQPIDLTLNGAAHLDAESVTGQLALGGQPGELKMEFDYAPKQNVPGPRPQGSLVSAVLSGQSFVLPEFNVKANGHLDLAVLARAVPALLPLRKDTTVSSGRFVVQEVMIAGGAQPSAMGQVGVTDVQLLRGGRNVPLQPITLSFNAAVTQPVGTVLHQAVLQAPFGQITASATPPNFQSEFRFDLAAMRQWLSDFADVGDFDLSGRVAGNCTGVGGRDAAIDLKLQATMDALRYHSGDRNLAVQSASLQHEGQIQLSQQQVRKYVVRRHQVQVDQALTYTVTGEINLQDGTFQAEAEVARADLAALSQYASQLGSPALQQYAGMAQFKTTARRESSSGPILLAGQGRVENLRIGGENAAEGPVTMAWDDVRITPNPFALAVGSMQLQSSFAQFRANDVRLTTGPQFELLGKAQLNADVQQVLKLASLAQQQEPPHIGGALQWRGEFAAPNPNELTMQGQGRIENFTVGTGEQALAQQQVAFEYNTRLDRQQDFLAIQRASLTSPALTAQAAGTIKELSQGGVLDLSGRYTGSWEQLTAILHELAPDTKQTVSFTGTTSSDFTVSGPASRPNVVPTYRGVAASGQVGWASAQVFGISIGQVLLQPRLDEGHLVLPMTAMPASGGKMNVGCNIDLSQKTPVLRMPGKTQVFDRMEVNPTMGHFILSRINPIFADTVSMQGYVTLTLQDIDLPMGDEIKRTGRGSGHLDLSEMKIEPAGVFKVLADLGNVVPGKVQAMQIEGVDFRIENGRVYYQNFTVIIAAIFDLKFYGSVGFDDTLDLTVSLPVRPRLLEAVGFKGPIADTASKLTDIRVDIPMKGSRLVPTLDLSAVNLGPIMQRAGKTLMLDQATGAGKQILQAPSRLFGGK